MNVASWNTHVFNLRKPNSAHTPQSLSGETQDKLHSNWFCGLQRFESKSLSLAAGTVSHWTITLRSPFECFDGRYFISDHQRNTGWACHYLSSWLDFLLLSWNTMTKGNVWGKSLQGKLGRKLTLEAGVDARPWKDAAYCLAPHPRSSWLTQAVYFNNLPRDGYYSQWARPCPMDH